MTDQEQTILRAINALGRNGIATVDKIVRGVGYPKATTKRALIALADKGLINLHRHDWPASLSPAERKTMIRRQDNSGRWNYYNAVSVMKKNPRKKRKANKAPVKAAPTKHAAKTKKALKTTGRALKGAARALLGAGSQILTAGASALNPKGRKRRANKTIIKAKRIGKVVTTNPRKRRNADRKDSDHPVEVKHHYRAGPPGYLTPWQRAHAAGQSQLFETGIRPATPRKKRNTSKKRKGAKVIVKTCNPRAKGSKKRGKIVAARARAGAKQRARKKRGNPTATEIRQEFAGRAGAGRDLFFPKGTPAGDLAKLGKLVLIKTTGAGVIAPTNGVAWLCCDEGGRLHIGTTSQAPLFDGPARNLGHVTRVEYEETKPHLGYPNPIIWHHKMGQETGQTPTLHADGRGGIVFRGGAYRITSRGIEN